MRIFATLVALLISSCSLGSFTQPGSAPKSAVSPVMHSVVALYHEDPLAREGRFVYCAGVSTGGLVVTASHCVDDDSSTKGNMWFYDGRTSGFSAVSVDIDHDLAVLLPLDAALPDGRELADYAPRRGDGVVVVGHPMGLEWTMTDGIVSDPLREMWGNGGYPFSFMQISAPVHPGNSGGPVFNVYGEVIGIVSFTWGGSNSLIGAAALPHIRQLVEKH